MQAMNTPHAPSIEPATLPRVLLVEDDPTTRLYLATIVRGVPAAVDCAESLAAAVALADAHAHDLWLFDAHLPDGRGCDLLEHLRGRHPRVPALAHTASSEPALRAELIGAGFAEVLVKPLTAAQLQSAVRRALGLSVLPATAAMASDCAGDELPLWDDQAAARAMNFNDAHIAALRGLFLQELPQAHALIVAAAREGDVATMAANLHKLRASCGFVGAARLAASVAALQQHPGSAGHAASFDAAAQATASAAAQSSVVVEGSVGRT